MRCINLLQTLTPVESDNTQLQQPLADVYD